MGEATPRGTTGMNYMRYDKATCKQWEEGGEGMASMTHPYIGKSGRGGTSISATTRQE